MSAAPLTTPFRDGRYSDGAGSQLERTARRLLEKETLGEADLEPLPAEAAHSDTPDSEQC